MIHTLRAEWTKALTLRSIQGTIAAALLVPPVLAFASALAFDGEAPTAASFPIESHGFETAGFGQPLIILLAALIAGTEYMDAQLATTLTATPRRGRVLAAKFIVTAAAAVAVGILATSAGVLLEHAALGEHGLSVSEFTAGMGWNLVGVAVNYALIGLIAAAVTVLARTFIVTLVVLVPLVLGLTISWLGPIPALRFLPDLAGLQLLTGYPGLGLLDPILGAVVMAAWAALLCIASWLGFRRRDTTG
jgi:ABC-2 type transport system permease protein